MLWTSFKTPKFISLLSSVGRWMDFRLPQHGPSSAKLFLWGWLQCSSYCVPAYTQTTPDDTSGKYYVGIWLVFADCCMVWNIVVIKSPHTVWPRFCFHPWQIFSAFNFTTSHTEEPPFGNCRIGTAVARGQCVQQLWTGKQQNVSHSLKMSGKREMKGAAAAVFLKFNRSVIWYLKKGY